MKGRWITASLFGMAFTAAPVFAQHNDKNDDRGSVASSTGAQAAPVQVVSGDDSGAILVTARRRGENLAKVPQVVIAISGDQLERRNITQQTDLQTSVPGLMVRQTESQNNLNYVIRGQSVDAFSGSATAVVPYINEVQFAPGGQSSFFDLQSLQVLKGPQGTLFGRNATGGAVLTTTAKPVNELTGLLQASGGNYGSIDVQGMLNVPIVDDKVLLRLAFDATYRDGYVHNLFNGQDTGKTDRQVGRLSLTLRPSTDFENNTVFQYERAGGNNADAELYSYYKCGQRGPTGIALTCSADQLYGPQLDANIGYPGAWAAYLAAHPGANPGGIAAALAEQKAIGFFNSDEAVETAHRGRDWFVTNSSSLHLNDSTELKNIFGASHSYTSDLASEVGAPFVILSTYDYNAEPPTLGTNANDETVSTISDEPQIQGKALGRNLDYVIGGYFAQTKTNIYYPATYTELTPVFPVTPGVFTSVSNFDQTDTQKAVYAHGSLDLTGIGMDKLTLSAGVRYTWEHIKSDQLAASRFFGAAPLEVSFSKPSWNVGLDYKLTPTLLVYATTRGSWRTGGINGIARPLLATAADGGSVFLPETTHDFEIGAKFSGDFGGKPTHLYLAAYRQIINNVQRTQLINVPISPGVTQPLDLTVNAPSARVQGFEGDFGSEITPWLEVGAVGAYTAPKYSNKPFTAFGQDFTFDSYADTPKWSGSVHATVNLPIPEDSGKLSVRGELYAQTSFNISNTSGTITPDTLLPGYTVVNFNAEWVNVLGHKGLTARLYLRNAFDKGYYVGGFALGNLLGVNSANVGEPRMFGGGFKVAF